MFVEGNDRLNLPSGTLTWDGMPNVAWAAHLQKGVSTIFATQLLPEYDEKALGLSIEFFKRAWKPLETEIDHGYSHRGRLIWLLKPTDGLHGDG